MIGIVAEVLEKTKDIHVGLQLGDDIDYFPDFQTKGIVEELYYQFGSQEEFESFFEFVLYQIEEVFPRQVQDLYLDQEGEFIGAEDDAVTYRWGTLGKAGSDNIGYLSLSSFGELEPTQTEENQALDQAMVFLQKTDGLVIDVRNNLGGSYNLTLYLAGFFAAEKTHVFNRQAYFNASELAPVESVFASPS